MSAFMVSKEHIDLLVHLALWGPSSIEVPFGQWRPYNPLELDKANELGELLVKENLSSIHCRYPDTITNPDATPGPCEQYWLKPYEYRDPQYRMTCLEALNAIACYEYQSSEHPEWKQSQAREFCEHLRKRVVSVLPGINSTPWQWDEETLQERRQQQPKPVRLLECGSCGQFHPEGQIEPGGSANYRNDCRYDQNRYNSAEEFEQRTGNPAIEVSLDEQSTL
jgi:hypothetical protein